MPNSNCLEGISCPECGYEDEFRIVAECLAVVTDNGVEDHANNWSWKDASIISCPDCWHTARIRDFKKVVKNED